MKNTILAAVIGFSLVVSLSGVVLAQTATSTGITPQDLIGGDPGLLPTSPLYFLKNWGWAIQKFFTFNPVAKAELDLHITNVKAAEIAKLQESVSNNAEAVAKALENYQSSVTRLQSRLQSLTQTSQNPNMTTLLQNLADRAVKHEALFHELEIKFSTSTEINDLIRQNNDYLDEILKEADDKDDSGNFGQILSDVLTNASSSIYGERAIEVLSHLQEVLPEKAEEMMRRVREKIQERIQGRLEEASSSDNGDDLELEDLLEDLDNCGSMPTSTGGWECDDGMWRPESD
ncbi:MAG: hypothetical protein UY23_C0006G0003 [Candidatus Jorgensenbacteria bacterium GW2011_GWA1_48_11]|uniref:DUF5667 domain-containing protein n=1 Tax=Candidatus Jorgensenbacteria bacterium GW2011_GWA1_48_11 TaxID=1618660 RepID=A0A0G1U9M0_9BACT|nr:MAG: hypothetical protein UY23_C0006G0003 [Candidatus Jorgensenbacteria bacterium GW2011_GWA1_48_11]KKW12429.1 MAG: hypothetical protein UY51_C0005G0671 [Candidatus Jorgensenbacteria bacterium GW2011_GWB1_49_9]